MKKLFILALWMPALTFSQNCKGVEEKTDKYTGERTLNTSTWAPVILYKTIKGSDTSYFVSLQTKGLTPTAGAKGVFVIFSDGSTFIDESIGVKSTYVSGNKYDYSATFKISAESLIKFTKLEVSDFKLFIYEEKIGKLMGAKMMQAFQCLRSK